jgi:hypothetical protein
LKKEFQNIKRQELGKAKMTTILITPLETTQVSRTLTKLKHTRSTEL